MPAVAKIEKADAQAAGRSMIRALARRDFDALERLLDPALEARALLPSGFRQFSSAADLIVFLRSWLETPEGVALVHSQVEEFVDRLRLTFRLRLSSHPFGGGDGEFDVEQHVFATLEDGRVRAVDFLCSGFRPSGDAASA